MICQEKNMRDIKSSLIWITELLKRLDIPFQIAGGLAAHAYGTTRELWDIDIDIPEDKFELLKPHVKPFIIYGPEVYTSKNWQLLLMTLNHHDQLIDLGGAYNTQIFNPKTNQWHKLITDFSKAIPLKILGLTLPVISRTELIAYKKILSRTVDLQDISEIEKLKAL
jgi:hypothetical protein